MVGQHRQRSGSQPLEWLGRNPQHEWVNPTGISCQNHKRLHTDTARHAQAENLLHSEKLHAHMSRQDYLQILECLYYIDKCYQAKEHADFQAKMESLNEQTKRLRGRPPTGTAMTDAEKQRAKPSSRGFRL